MNSQFQDSHVTLSATSMGKLEEMKRQSSVPVIPIGDGAHDVGWERDVRFRSVSSQPNNIKTDNTIPNEDQSKLNLRPLKLKRSDTRRNQSIPNNAKKEIRLEFYKVLQNDGLIAMCRDLGIKTLFSNLGILSLISRHFIRSTKPRIHTKLAKKYQQSMRTPLQEYLFDVSEVLNNLRYVNVIKVSVKCHH